MPAIRSGVRIIQAAVIAALITSETAAASAASPVITAISPSSPIAGGAQTLTISGENFEAGLSVMAIPSGQTPSTFRGAQLQSLTSTSVEINIALVAGFYSFAITNPSGERSNSYSIRVQDEAVRNWTQEGARLTDVTAGFPGQSLANVSAFRLNDGSWRMLFTAGSSIRSAVSPDGLLLTMEPGTRIADSGTCGHVRALRLDDGRIRVFCRTPRGILTYISSDEGVTLSAESGRLLISNEDVGAARLSTGGIVRTADGRWRLYFSDDFIAGGGAPPPMRILSAVSTDMANWTIEPGVRIGAGATAGGSANHPSAIVGLDGTVSVYYTRHGQNPRDPALAIWVATSSDGLTFTSDTYTGLPGADVDVVAVGDGIRLYYNLGDDRSSTVYSAVSAGTRLTAAQKLSLLNGAAVQAARNEAHAIRTLTDQTLDLLSPAAIPVNHAIRERIARAEENFRFNWHRAISEEAATEAATAWLHAIGATGIDRHQLHVHRMEMRRSAPQLVGAAAGQSLDDAMAMSPVEATAVILSVVAEAHARTAGPGRFSDQSGPAPWQLHAMLDLLGLRR